MLINAVCPNCGGQAQLEAGRSAICPYCGSELTSQTAAQVQGAFAQDMQFAPPPAQRMPQMQQADRYAPAMHTDPAQFAVPAAQTPDLQKASKKKLRWYLLNAAMLAILTITVGISVTLLEHYRGQQGQRLIMGWLLTLPVSGFFSGFLRPDDAYIDKKPMFKSKITQGIAHFLLSIPVSAVAGCILYAIVDTLLNSF